MNYIAILMLLDKIVQEAPAAMTVIQDILTDISHFKDGKLTEADVQKTLADGLAVLKDLTK